MKNKADLKEILANHSEIIEKWLEYLRLIEERHNVICVLCGGCLRDLVLDRKVKDLDVFVIPKAPYTEDELTEDFDKLVDGYNVTIRWTRTYSGSSCQ